MKWRGIGRVLALLIAYVVTARLGLMMDAVGGFATLVWPPTGLALFALFRWGRTLWPGVFLGALIVNFWIGAPLPTALGIAAGNTLEAVVGAALLRRARFDAGLGRIRDVIALVFEAGFLGAAVSATIGVTSLRLGGTLRPEAAQGTWTAWWVGDLLGDVIVGSLLFLWWAEGRAAIRSFSRERLAEALSLGAAIFVSADLVFADLSPMLRSTQFERAYLLFPVLIWAALRFGPRGAATATFVVDALAIAGTAAGRGPFLREGLSASLLPLGTFVGVSAFTALLLAAAVADRDRARVAAERSVRARDEFLSVASHELLTPLASLELQVASLSRASQRDGAVPAEKLASKLEMIDRQTDRLARLIRTLLDVSRISAGKLTLELEEVDWAEVVREATERLGAKFTEAACTLTLDIESPCVGRWDRMRLEQIVTNLLSNALKYGAGKSIEVRLKSSGASCILSVRDHGIGIAPQDQARIFERFERSAPHRQFPGLGLGLWIVREIVGAMDGNVVVSSQPGEGAEFSVSLPRTPVGAPAADGRAKA